MVNKTIKSVSFSGSRVEWLEILAALRAQQHAEAMAEALEPFVTGYSHTSVFLSSREKMHSAGRDLYREEVESARAALAAYRSVK